MHWATATMHFRSSTRCASPTRGWSTLRFALYALIIKLMQLSLRGAIFWVLPPPRDQNGALCPSDEWRLEIFLNDPSNSSSTQILDATFPQQFDNHICTIDASGVITFWDIYGGDTTSLITGVPHVQMLCFGSEQHSQCNRILACQLHVP